MNLVSGPSRRILIAALLCCAAARASANPLDSDGYIMNWTGPIKPEYNGVVLPSPPLPPIPTLKSDLAAATSSASLCQQIEQAMSSVSQIKQFDSCSFPVSELRGKMIGPNTLGLKIIFAGINIDFEVSGIAGDNPKIKIVGNVEIDVGINFASSIDGSITNTNPAFTALPMTVIAPTVQFSDINLSTQNVIANVLNDLSSAFGGPTFSKLANTLAQQGGQYGGALTSQLNAAITSQNGVLHTAAALLTAGIKIGAPPPKDPLANGFFLLAVGIDSSQSFVIDFQRDGMSPPIPGNCFVQSLSYATVTASCYSYAANGTVTFDKTDAISMNRLDPAGWDVADDGVSNSWDVPPPRFSVPFFQDTNYQTYPNPPATASYQFCSFNQWGGGCGAAISVTLDLRVAPAVVVGPPLCGPNSHPYRPCLAFKAVMPGMVAPAPIGGAR